jgi:CheY-like chemotaxis protein
MATVLVVDDDPVIQRVLAHILKKADHTVLIARNGFEALERLATAGVDLAIVDLAMPEMDGLTLVKRLRADERRKTLPIIMLTASGQDEDGVTARTVGVNAFLTKPTSSRELTDVVSRLLARNSA